MQYETTLVFSLSCCSLIHNPLASFWHCRGAPSGGCDEIEVIRKVRGHLRPFGDNDELEVVEAVLRELVLLEVVSVVGLGELEEVGVANHRAVAQHVPQPRAHSIEPPCHGLAPPDASVFVLLYHYSKYFCTAQSNGMSPLSTTNGLPKRTAERGERTPKLVVLKY
jgi:hypothetical protein